MADVSLEDFVFETLTSISQGVAKAQKRSQENDGIPIALATTTNKDGNAVDVKLGEQLVSFSVAVEAHRDSKAEGNAEFSGKLISVVSARARVGGWLAKRNKQLHTIEFSVPMYFNSKWDKGEGSK